MSLCRSVASRLCQLPSEKLSPFPDGTTLLFPTRRTSKKASDYRASEAEARILFCLELASRGFPFAVEVPTRKTYKFRGATEMSARTDVVVFSRSGGRELAVEFKARPAEDRSITKDIEKLVREGYDGLWFHLLQNVNSRTLRSLFSKFTSAFTETSEKHPSRRHNLTFVFVVRKKRFWLRKTISPNDNPSLAFDFEYKLRPGKIEVTNAHGWEYEPL